MHDNIMLMAKGMYVGFGRKHSNDGSLSAGFDAWAPERPLRPLSRVQPDRLGYAGHARPRLCPCRRRDHTPPFST